jgi:hypothetical protein
VESWASRQQAGGGENIQMVCQHAAERVPNVGDIYVICDGAVTPFSQGDSDGRWARFRANYPNIKFHMVALDRDADIDTMSKVRLLVMFELVKWLSSLQSSTSC